MFAALLRAAQELPRSTRRCRRARSRRADAEQKRPRRNRAPRVPGRAARPARGGPPSSAARARASRAARATRPRPSSRSRRAARARGRSTSTSCPPPVARTRRSRQRFPRRLRERGGGERVGGRGASALPLRRVSGRGHIVGERKAFARATRASRSTSRLKPRSTSAGPRIIRTVCASGGVSAPKTGRVAARARARTGRLELGSVSERVSRWPRNSSAARSSAAPDERASGAKPSREPRGRSSPLRDAASLRESARPASSRTLVGAGRRLRLEMTLETVLRLVARRLTQLAKFLVDFPRKYRSRKPRRSSTTWAHQI